MYYYHRLLSGAYVMRLNSFIEFFMRCHIYLYVCGLEKFFRNGEAVFYLFKNCVIVSRVVIHLVRYIFSYHQWDRQVCRRWTMVWEKFFVFFKKEFFSKEKIFFIKGQC
jgi:hypothetical protein